ncbi:hypothetical protein [Metabacillus sp. RGM 3146]|uniref:hypothetical protein n=1 Tax=Metabacillus sp. RGM 3146 TaxID=3401092 RepID=UPI003B9A381E
MNNWMTALLNANLFGKKRRNKGRGGWVWGTLIGIGLSAAAYVFGRNQNMMGPLQNMMKQGSQNQNMGGLTEFSKELAPNNMQNTTSGKQAPQNRASHNANQNPHNNR